MRAVKTLERILYTIPIMLGVAIIVFIFIRLTPGDPVDIMMGQGGAISAGEIEQLRSEFHLDEPISTQLWYFLRDATQGDLGYSYIKKKRSPPSSANVYQPPSSWPWGRSLLP